MEKQPRHSLNSSSSSFSKIGWRRTRTTKWQSPWIHHTAENGLHFQALGAVYIFDRYGVINNGFFAKKKKKRGRKEKKENGKIRDTLSSLFFYFFKFCFE